MPAYAAVMMRGRCRFKDAYEETTNADGEAVIRAKALKVSDGVTITASGTLNGTTYSRSGTLTVTDTTVSSIAVDCGDASMAAGLDVSCTATATFSPEPDEDIIINDDLTESVVWSSGDTSVMTASTTTPGVFTGIAAGSAGAIATLDDVSNSTNVTVTDGIIESISITNTETSVNSGETLQMTAEGTTTAGTEDVTSRVTWSVDDPGSTWLEETPGLLIAESGVATDKNIIVTAAVDSLSIVHELIIKNALIYACGTGVNDTDSNNAVLECLKIASDNAGIWFTSTPSIAVIEALGYSLSTESGSSGDTYNNTLLEDGSYGPVGGEFVEFRYEGPGGPSDRWCEKLTSLNFAGRGNWQNPTKKELLAFYDQYGDVELGLWGARGWPTIEGYWTTTQELSYYYYVELYNGHSDSIRWDSTQYTTCMSESE